MARRFLRWTLFAVCASAVLFVVVGGHVGTVVGDPLRLWSRWLSGEKVDGARLWGWPMLAWGRTGKLLQFAAGLTVVLDLLGPDRLREFGNRLRHPSWQRLADRLEPPIMIGVAFFLIIYHLLIIGSVVVKPPQAATQAISRLLLGPVGIAGVLLSFLSVGFLALQLLTRSRVKEGASLLVRYPHILLVSGIPMVIWIAVTRGLLIPLTSGLAKAFDRTNPGHPLRWLAFALFIVGFGFDLLAS